MEVTKLLLAMKAKKSCIDHRHTEEDNVVSSMERRNAQTHGKVLQNIR